MAAVMGSREEHGIDPLDEVSRYFMKIGESPPSGSRQIGRDHQIRARLAAKGLIVHPIGILEQLDTFIVDKHVLEFCGVSDLPHEVLAYGVHLR